MCSVVAQFKLGEVLETAEHYQLAADLYAEAAHVARAFYDDVTDLKAYEAHLAAAIAWRRAGKLEQAEAEYVLSLHATGAVRGAANALCNIERTLDNLVTVYDQHMTAHGGSLTSEDQVPGLAAAVNLLLAAVGNKAFKEYAGFVKQALTRQAAKDPKGRLIAAAMAAPDVTAVRSVLLGCLNPKIDSLEMRKFRTRRPTDDRKLRSQMKGAAALRL